MLGSCKDFGSLFTKVGQSCELGDTGAAIGQFRARKPLQVFKLIVAFDVIVRQRVGDALPVEERRGAARQPQPPAGQPARRPGAPQRSLAAAGLATCL